MRSQLFTIVKGPSRSWRWGAVDHIYAADLEGEEGNGMVGAKLLEKLFGRGVGAYIQDGCY